MIKRVLLWCIIASLAGVYKSSACMDKEEALRQEFEAPEQLKNLLDEAYKYDEAFRKCTERDSSFNILVR